MKKSKEVEVLNQTLDRLFKVYNRRVRSVKRYLKTADLTNPTEGCPDEIGYCRGFADAMKEVECVLNKVKESMEKPNGKKTT